MAPGQAKPERVEIGFGGGQVLAARLDGNQLAELRQALTSTKKLSGEAASWHDLETEDGPVSLDLREVVFVRVAGGEHRIGFSQAG
jgi:hypothetical protein